MQRPPSRDDIVASGLDERRNLVEAGAQVAARESLAFEAAIVRIVIRLPHRQAAVHQNGTDDRAPVVSREDVSRCRTTAPDPA